MTDFLIRMMTLYPWFTWLLVVFAAVGVGYGSLWLAGGVMVVSEWASYRRAVWRRKAAVRESGHLCESCAAVADKVISLMDDPPEYQHPDGDDDELTELWDEPPDDWSPAAEWGEKPWRSLGTLAEILAALGRMNDDDQLPDGPYVPPEEHGMRPLAEVMRCNNRDCYRYGEAHSGACDVAPTMPAACYTQTPGDYLDGREDQDDYDLPRFPRYLNGPAMPPQPVREYLHPQIMEDLKAAKFSEHETNEGAVESMFTRAQAREVQAMITDGVIPGGQEK